MSTEDRTRGMTRADRDWVGEGEPGEPSGAVPVREVYVPEPWLTLDERLGRLFRQVADDGWQDDVEAAGAGSPSRQAELAVRRILGDPELLGRVVRRIGHEARWRGATAVVAGTDLALGLAAPVARDLELPLRVRGSERAGEDESAGEDEKGPRPMLVLSSVEGAGAREGSSSPPGAGSGGSYVGVVAIYRAASPTGGASDPFHVGPHLVCLSDVSAVPEST